MNSSKPPFCRILPSTCGESEYRHKLHRGFLCHLRVVRVNTVISSIWISLRVVRVNTVMSSIRASSAIYVWRNLVPSKPPSGVPLRSTCRENIFSQRHHPGFFPLLHVVKDFPAYMCSKTELRKAICIPARGEYASTSSSCHRLLAT